VRGPLIIGGGPAGASAAIRLAQSGVAALVVERSVGPHDKVCGDFLTSEAVTALESLGVHPGTLGAAAIREVRIVLGERIAAARLPFAAVGLSRRVLDEALLTRVVACGAEVRRGVTVRSMVSAGCGFRAATSGGLLTAEAVFLATGKHDLRGTARPRSRRTVGLKAYVRLGDRARAELGEAVEIVLVPGGYAGLQMVEGGVAVLCALLSDGRLASGGLAGVVNSAPHLDRRLQGARWLTARPLAVAGMPYGYIAAGGGRLFRLGDQAAVIPSFAGAGVAIAVATGMAAARAYHAGENAAAFQRAVGGRVARPVRLAWNMHQGLICPVLREIGFGIGRTWPGLMRWAALATRVPVADVS
jgi:menaquinone-9 beta-reductase